MSEGAINWPEKDVEVVAPQAEWPRIRDDPRFVELMRLARATNSLGIAFGPLLHTLADQSPDARRNRFAAFIYSAALLKEGLDSAGSLGTWFREAPHYKEGLGSILSDPLVKRLRSDILDKLRDKLVFHFDRDALADGFRRFPTNGDVRILTYPTGSPTFGETYFDAADDAVLAFLFGTAATDQEYFARIEAFMEKVGDLLRRFMPASHKLIAIGLIALGCQKRSMKRQAGNDEEAI